MTCELLHTIKKTSNITLHSNLFNYGKLKTKNKQNEVTKYKMYQ